jgi:Amt family ammonium transporter
MNDVTTLAGQITELSYALDTLYFLMMGALVMWMAAGFTMLEAGLVRAKNTAEILTKNVGLYSIACIMYMLSGYSIMYPGEFEGAIFQSLRTLGTGLLSAGDNLTADVLASGGDTYYSNLADFFFQVVFVATAMSIVSGAVAERMKLWSFFAFAAVLTGFIYPVQGFWKWGGGWLERAPLRRICRACRRPAPRRPKRQIWSRWTGECDTRVQPATRDPRHADPVARLVRLQRANAVARVFVNTNMAAAGGLVFALLLSRAWFGKADLTMALNGALAGLVAITAEPLAPTPFGATLIGGVGGLLVVLSIVTLDKLRLDDPVGAISVHGTVGIWGLLAVPIYNGPAKLWVQIVGLLSIFLWVFLMSLLVWFLIRLSVGIRVDEQHEYEGVDLTECGLEAYPEFAVAD